MPVVVENSFGIVMQCSQKKIEFRRVSNNRDESKLSMLLTVSAFPGYSVSRHSSQDDIKI